MLILRNVYDELLRACPKLPPETGGLIGGRNDIITAFMLDRPGAHGRYAPDVNILNKTIAEWQERDISFYGLWHSHCTGGDELSTPDIIYIKKIMQAMPGNITRLYFPLVFPGDKLLPFVATRSSDGVHIEKDALSFIL